MSVKPTDNLNADLNWELYRPYAVERLTGVKWNIYVDTWENDIIVSKRDRIQVGRKTHGTARYRKLSGLYGNQKPGFEALFYSIYESDVFGLEYFKLPAGWHRGEVSLKGLPKRGNMARRVHHKAQKPLPYVKDAHKWKHRHPKSKRKRFNLYKEEESNYGRKLHTLRTSHSVPDTGNSRSVRGLRK